MQNLKHSQPAWLPQHSSKPVNLSRSLVPENLHNFFPLIFICSDSYSEFCSPPYYNKQTYHLMRFKKKCPNQLELNYSPGKHFVSFIRPSTLFDFSILAKNVTLWGMLLLQTLIYSRTQYSLMWKYKSVLSDHSCCCSKAYHHEIHGNMQRIS